MADNIYYYVRNGLSELSTKKEQIEVGGWEGERAKLTDRPPRLFWLCDVVIVLFSNTPCNNKSGYGYMSTFFFTFLFLSSIIVYFAKKVQWASPKTRMPYDFSSYVGSMRHIPKNFRSAALSTATQPWWSAALPTRRNNSRRSWVLVLLKRLIAPNTSITAIKPFRSTRTHHGKAPEYATS
jgi:hypothetical protein